MSHEYEGPPTLEPGAGGHPQDRSNEAQQLLLDSGMHRIPQENNFPPGLLGECAHWVLAVSPRPVPEIALATALAMLCGIAGRAYNIKGQGLNQYIIIVGYTGSGKDIAQSFPENYYSTLRPSVAAIDSFRGPSELGSAPGFIKWLEQNPCVLCAFGEIGLLLASMTKPNASLHLAGIMRLLLQVYSKSGKKGSLGSTAYSEKFKNNAVIPRPSVTIVGETTPEVFYENLNEGLISSGLIPRFMVFEYLGEQVELGEDFDTFTPCPQLVQRLADFAANCLTLNNNNQICDVTLTAEAELILNDYEKFARDQLNGTPSESIKQLWNRAHLKALKLAAICAVGINPMLPVIGHLCAQWAIDVITHQTQRLISKIEQGDVGRQGGNQTKQEREVVRVIAEYLNNPYSDKYHGTPEMLDKGVITQSHIQMRLSGTAAFREDPRGAKDALTRTLKSLLEADIIREIPHSQMTAMFGKHPRAFAVSDPAAILKPKHRSF